MARKVMDRRASDNKYLHKDFHGAMLCGLEYVFERYGQEGFEAYVRQTAAAIHAPLRDAIRQRGLPALEEYLRDIFTTEEGDFSSDWDGDALVFSVNVCPAVSYLQQHGYDVPERFCEVTRIMNQVICEGTGFASEVDYDTAAAKCVQRFFPAARDGEK